MAFLGTKNSGSKRFHTPQPFPWPSSAPRAWISDLQTPVAQSWPAQHQNSVRPPKNREERHRRGRRWALGVFWKPSLRLGGFNWISTTKPCYLMGVQLPFPQLVSLPDFWTINTIKQSDIWLVVSANPLEKICSSKWVHLPLFLVCENRKIVETVTT